jgi:ribonucleotide reductase beta subunit family protein with ferritin-like domain
MIDYVLKRDGTVEKFDQGKINTAVEKAMKSSKIRSKNLSQEISDNVVVSINTKDDNTIGVDEIHKTVENVIMDMGLHNLAREYITYRVLNKPDIFRKRYNLKPYEYPQFIEYLDAIRHSYWVHTEFSFTSDIQDMKVKMTSSEIDIIKKAMLAIAQIEVQVKTFWAKIGDKMPKPEVQAVGITFGECHVDGTEILTPNGWVDFRNINEDTIVMQYNTHTGNMEETTTSAIVREPYSGKIYALNNRTYNAKVTPDHRFLYFNKNGNLIEKKAKDIKSFHSEMKLPYTAPLSNNGDTKLTPIERLRIAIQADSSSRYYTNSSGCHTYEISVKKDRKKDRLFSLLSEAGLTYRTFNISQSDYVKIEIDFDQEYDLKEFGWVNLSNKSKEWCEDFIQELTEWDGYRLGGKGNSKNCLIKYSTTNKNCADIAQAIGFGAGYRANINRYEDNRKQSYKDVYTVSFVKSNPISSTTTKFVEEHYDGNIHCVTVPSGAIITRYNNKVLISGNSEVRHADAYSNLLEIMGLNEEFKTLVEVPAIKKRMEYLEQSIQAPVDNKDYFYKVILFSMFVENVSLFSQFLIMMAFNKHKNLLKGISNAVSATQKEEDIHARFGFELVNVIKAENPDWWDKDTISNIIKQCKDAYKAEVAIVDWIYGDHELDFLPKEVVKEFLKHRFNQSLQAIDIKPIYEINEEMVKSTDWFIEESLTTTNVDFFVKRATTYSKKTKSFSEDDLF